MSSSAPKPAPRLAVGRWPMVIALVATAVLVTCQALSMTASWASARSERQASAHASVLRAAAVLLVEVQMAESGQRGYLLTGRANYLSSYVGATGAIPRSLANLQSLAGAREASLLTAISTEVATKTAELQRTVALRQSGRVGDALAVVNTGQGQQSMVRLTSDLQALEARAQARFATADRLARDTRAAAVAAAAVGTSVALLFLGVLCWLIVQRRRLALAKAESETDRRRLLDELSELATHDPLTSLPNRRLLLDRLQHALDQREHSCLAVMFIDLDNFKQVNDALGHAAGDATLVEVSEKMRAALRPGDTLGRVGGDEFVAICEGLHSRAEGEQLALRLQRTASAQPAAELLPVTASVGLALVDSTDGVIAGPKSTGTSGDSVLGAADAALYRAKAAGRNRVAMHGEAMVLFAGIDDEGPRSQQEFSSPR
ncbi:diguanylate cyclase [Jatrophihabitans telluris]|uniref:Diguanylate cyclase n=1 Tax=Jatrophihabitans telluris TaxID=2038343 RepID=A0ABY4QYR9_9ACTN|nr:diguanylate cyclase [Jatrophihabitans telluris]UQX88427.1 diguanylate cyclase [Jatrophihabitans telluris]